MKKVTFACLNQFKKQRKDCIVARTLKILKKKKSTELKGLKKLHVLTKWHPSASSLAKQWSFNCLFVFTGSTCEGVDLGSPGVVWGKTPLRFLFASMVCWEKITTVATGCQAVMVCDLILY